MIEPFKPEPRLFENDPEQECKELALLEEIVRKSKGPPLRKIPQCYLEAAGLNLDTEVGRLMVVMAVYLLNDEQYLNPVSSKNYKRMTAAERGEERSLLYQRRYYLENFEHIDKRIADALRGIADALEPIEFFIDPFSPFEVPLYEAHPDTRGLVQEIHSAFLGGQSFEQLGMFKELSQELVRNRARTRTARSIYLFPYESDLGPKELVETYLEDTFFAELLKCPLRMRLTHEDRFNHMHIVGGTGAGKTTLIEHLIMHDIQWGDQCSLIVIDPHSDLVRRLQSADLGIEDRLLVIDPRDVEYPPALNVFAMNRKRLGTYDAATREQVTAGVIQTFDYLFSGIIGADLTAKQGVFFRYVARLMLSLPETMGRNATILDMLNLMVDPVPYGAAIAALPDIPREFFVRDFMSKNFAQTKEQIRYRLQSIVENPTMARLFTSQETKVDLFTEMNRGAIILVDTAKDFLKGNSATFGRLFVSLVLQAVLERAAIPEKDRRHTFLIVDEAASYFDSNIDDLLTEARKYKCGLVLAHQYLDQASSSLRASLAANTGIKFASGLSASDARSMATDMRTTPDFILSQPRLRFAAHVRNVTRQAVSIEVKPGVLAAMPQLSEQKRAMHRAYNRERVSSGRQSPPPAEPIWPTTPDAGERSSPPASVHEAPDEW